jgi:NADH dehydrogenase
MRNIIVIGAGFAGLWSALGAARRLDELGISSDDVTITMVNRDAWHSIRVRNYENDISDARVPLADLLDPVGIRLVVGDVTAIDNSARTIGVATETGVLALAYDRLVIAAGSQQHLPDIAGLSEHGFFIDTWEQANALDRHLSLLPDQIAGSGRDTVLIVGAGLTGVELACEMPDRLRGLGLTGTRTILADTQDHIGSDMGPEAVPVIVEALSALGVETRTSTSVTGIDALGATLADGSRIDAATTVWTAGLIPSPLAALVAAPRDAAGRLRVDSCMRVLELDGIFAVGDIAAAPADETHSTVMSCQHARPMGRFAGHNVVSDLVGEELLPLNFGPYNTCLDLGPWGSLYTTGWERRVVSKGQEVKKTKQTTKCVRIYPPRGGNRRELLDAAAAVIQTRTAPATAPIKTD